MYTSRYLRVNQILNFMTAFSIAPTFGSLERDVRFIYCACSISFILNDWSGINIDKTVEHIKQLQVKGFFFYH